MRPLACVKLSNLKKSQGAQKLIFFAETWNVGSFYVLECKYQKIVKSFFFLPKSGITRARILTALKTIFWRFAFFVGKGSFSKIFRPKY